MAFPSSNVFLYFLKIIFIFQHYQMEQAMPEYSEFWKSRYIQ